MTLDPNFPKLVLDPATDSELVQLAYNRIQTASGNTITDFRPGSAVAALVEGQTFALSELLYYLNLMPEAIAIEVFRLYGVTRSLGTFALGAITFFLTETAVDPFVLPQGYLIPYLDANLVLATSLVIPVGMQEGSVNVTLDTIGTQYNAKPFDILATNTGLGRVQSIFNRLAFGGGSDLEPLEKLIPRCQAATVSRNTCITKVDYALSAQSFLGNGSRAVVLANTAPDQVSFLQNAVAVFTLDASGVPTTPVVNANLKADFLTKTLLGTSVACFPIVLQGVTVELNVTVRTLSEELGDRIIAKVMSYLNPSAYDFGQLVQDNEIAYNVRKVPMVLAVTAVLLNNAAADVLMPNLFTLPFASLVNVNMADLSGATLTVTGGVGQGDVYNDDDDDLL